MLICIYAKFGFCHPYPEVIGRAKRAPHWGVQSRFRVVCRSVCMYVCRGPKSVGGNTWAKRAHAQSQYCAVKSDQYHRYY